MQFAYMPDTHFGLYNQEVPSPKQVSEAFQHVIREAELAEQVGFDGVFLPERHMRPETFVPSTLAVAAAIAARTTTVKIATTVMLPVLYNPMYLAEQVAMIDNLSRGRFIFGVGVGYHQDYHRMMGIPWERRGARFDEAMTVILKAFTEEVFSFHGEFYHFDDVFLTPKTYQRPRPPIWIGGYAKNAVARSYDFEGWIPWMLPDWASAKNWIDKNRKAAEDHGNKDYQLILDQDGWIGDDPEAVRARHAPRWIRENMFYADQGTTPADINPRGDEDIYESDRFQETLRDFESRQLHFGTPESWRERIAAIRDTFHPNWLNIRTRGPVAEFGPPYPSFDESLECIERFGKEVTSAFR
jgi:alkanesulfonate monooxygenase SsuD/methylene tetrahydromethanopterin reductase-like flavin-dependent oxidoreductase (luciferase family)